ncbi:MULTISPECIES: phosphatase PAP2 family protein [unclassified Streptomyces]|uniref:phosphatase PAP2 family protein n=1 Tax=unclassified Streptomyces TaxID=2593676 RepID=UPI000DBA9122|nr:MULTISPECIES: phosphatase PAP2 family protein [unclassified Streptomyces]MYT74954.1 phosphatase PAP2 family protein [Streptomyces sp. SID8367]RAJ91946.1 undecaprenyl-diphosphatase [Streptomyces sp. PsTaAH-137]
MHSTTILAAAPQGYDGSGIDGTALTDVVDTAHRAPAWLDGLVSAYSSYGLILFGGLMLLGWWRARRQDAPHALRALAAPVLTVIAFAGSTLLKQGVHELRPCQSLHVVTLEACPAPGDWSFPSNHATLAAAAAVALWFVSARLGAVASVAALLMAASRVWVGAHYPHDVVAGLAVGAVIALALALPLSRRSQSLAELVTRTPLRPLVGLAA